MSQNDYPDVTCKECGVTHKAKYVEEVKNRMLKESLCFKCLHWTRWMENASDPNVVRVNHKHYYIGDEMARGMRGFGGSEWNIVFHDGRKITSTNLWFQGDIPKHFTDRLPDNAKFE